MNRISSIFFTVLSLLLTPFLFAQGPRGNGDPVRLARAGIEVGTPLPDVSIFDETGQPFETSSLRGNYSVLVFGCLT